MARCAGVLVQRLLYACAVKVLLFSGVLDQRLLSARQCR